MEGAEWSNHGDHSYSPPNDEVPTFAAVDVAEVAEATSFVVTVGAMTTHFVEDAGAVRAGFKRLLDLPSRAGSITTQSEGNNAIISEGGSGVTRLLSEPTVPGRKDSGSTLLFFATPPTPDIAALVLYCTVEPRDGTTGERAKVDDIRVGAFLTESGSKAQIEELLDWVNPPLERGRTQLGDEIITREFPEPWIGGAEVGLPCPEVSIEKTLQTPVSRENKSTSRVTITNPYSDSAESLTDVLPELGRYSSDAIARHLAAPEELPATVVHRDSQGASSSHGRATLEQSTFEVAEVGLVVAPFGAREHFLNIDVRLID